MSEAEPMVTIDDFLAVIKDLCPECCQKVKRALIHRLATKATPIPVARLHINLGIGKELVELLEAIAEDYGFSVDVLRGHCHQWNIMKARREFVNQARERGYSTPVIGKAIGRHHSTIIHLLKRTA